ncbi:MAG TPA: tRNA dihydrouridine synthase DusB [Rhodothermales bacterium]|nr:tRNA dihydrouridine synthase DusB [Rhodothermales bacterium]
MHHSLSFSQTWQRNSLASLLVGIASFLKLTLYFRMNIGPINLGDRPLFLAPMEDVSDPPFRILCKRYGADMLYTEFISSGGLIHDADNSTMKLDIYDEERPVGIQIFGGEVEQVREAAQIVDAVGPDLIDINFGCPVKKVVCKDGGAGILRNLPKMEAITQAVIESATRPVTVKTRLGWNDDSIRILEVAHMLEAIGVQALAVHARTRAQMYKGEARWPWLRRIKDEGIKHIPLIGNGDADSPDKIKAMFDETGVDGVMIGRGAIGNPWIFRDAKTYLATGEVPPPPSWPERLSVVAEHLTLKCEWLGERKGVLEMRRMYGGYFKGFRNASTLRQQIMEETTRDGVMEVLLNFREDEPEVQVAVAAPSPTRAAKALPAALRAKLPTPSRRQAEEEAVPVG